MQARILEIAAVLASDVIAACGGHDEPDHTPATETSATPASTASATPTTTVASTEIPSAALIAYICGAEGNAGYDGLQYERWEVCLMNGDGTGQRETRLPSG